MSIGTLQITLLIGRIVPTPAPSALMQALESVVVTQNGEGRSGFQITFRAERGTTISDDYALLKSDVLAPGRRVIIVTTVNAVPHVLMDGAITQHELKPAFGATPAMLTITGEDLSAMMDLYEIIMEYPGLPHAVIATAVIARYSILGVVPVVIPPLLTWGMPMEDVLPQRGTDLNYLRQLAAPFGYDFYIRPGPVAGMSVAFWGPGLIGSQRWMTPQKALTVDMGPATNVESIQFQYNSLAPAMTVGLVPDFLANLPIPVVTFASTRLPLMSGRPALPLNIPFVRSRLLDYRGSNAIEAYSIAQSQTNDSTAQVVTASGTLDTFRYGGLLFAPGRVGVRGVGYQYDGDYFVQSVTHQISHQSYTQSFTLTREGVGSLVTRVQTQ